MRHQLRVLARSCRIIFQRANFRAARTHTADTPRIWLGLAIYAGTGGTFIRRPTTRVAHHKNVEMFYGGREESL